jgi:hypothetical protein
MPNLSMPSGQATLEMAFWPLQGWPTHRLGGLQLSSTLFDSLRRTLMDQRLLAFQFFLTISSDQSMGVEEQHDFKTENHSLTRPPLLLISK